MPRKQAQDGPYKTLRNPKAIDKVFASLASVQRSLAITTEDAMEQPGLDNRHRDKNGQIARKHGNTLISTLRQTYGAHFAPDCPPDARLIDVLHRLDEPSLTHLIHDMREHGQGAPKTTTVTS